MAWYNNIIWFLAGLAFISVCVVFIILKVKSTKKLKIEIPPNAPMVRNYYSSKTNGYAEGLEIDFKEGKSGRLICKFVPTDNDTTKPRVLEVQTIVLERGMRVPLNDLSSKRLLVEYYPSSPTQLPKGFTRTEKGKFAQEYIVKMHNENVTEKYLEDGAKAKEAILDKFPLGELSKNMMAIQESFVENTLKLDIEKRKEDREIKK